MIVQSFEASLLSATMPKIWPKMKKCLDQLSINLFPMKPPKPIFWVPDLAQLLMVLSVYVCFFSYFLLQADFDYWDPFKSEY